ncbi:MAG: HDOD domain-containing protein [Planctomycetes bacterium]|nr:HDOD domain-containing protein [Planctomycetota bacterium]
MGLWDWIIDKLTASPTATNGPAPRRRAGTLAARDDGGVATLEAPPDAPAERAGGPARAWWAPEGVTATEPTPVGRPAMTTDALALENLLISHFDGHDLQMPPLMQAAERVLTELRDPECTFADVARLLADDPVIAGSVLRMANSALYRGMHKITSLQPAVARLGFKAVRTLMMHESLRSAMFRGKGRDELANLLWARSFAAGQIMYGLSAFTGVDKDDAFLMGLLHDIGCVIVLRIVRDERNRSHAEIDHETFEYLCAETHQEFGELIADAWKLPNTLKSLTSNHHEFPAEDDPLRRERLQLQLCDHICGLLGYSPTEAYCLLETRVVRALGLAERRDFLAYLDALPEQLEEAFDSF